MCRDTLYYRIDLPLYYDRTRTTKRGTDRFLTLPSVRGHYSARDLQFYSMSLHPTTFLRPKLSEGLRSGEDEGGGEIPLWSGRKSSYSYILMSISLANSGGCSASFPTLFPFQSLAVLTNHNRYTSDPPAVVLYFFAYFHCVLVGDSRQLVPQSQPKHNYDWVFDIRVFNCLVNAI